jgi:hypothetical protein
MADIALRAAGYIKTLRVYPSAQQQTVSIQTQSLISDNAAGALPRFAEFTDQAGEELDSILRSLKAIEAQIENYFELQDKDLVASVAEARADIRDGRTISLDDLLKDAGLTRDNLID